MRKLFLKIYIKLVIDISMFLKKNNKDKKIIKCFQRHYLPKNVTGKIDEKTYKISHFLAL